MFVVHEILSHAETIQGRTEARKPQADGFRLQDDTAANPHSVPQSVNGQASGKQAGTGENTVDADILIEMPAPTVTRADGRAA